MQLCAAMCEYGWLCIAMSGCVLLWVAMCSYVWLCVDMGGFM